MLRNHIALLAVALMAAIAAVGVGTAGATPATKSTPNVVHAVKSAKAPQAVKVVKAASSAKALASIKRSAEYPLCTHQCDYIPYGEQWCGVDHRYDHEYGPNYWYLCDRVYYLGGAYSYQWYQENYL